jgi:acetyltransferase-like isoleucine patch superfamily enzyme
MSKLHLFAVMIAEGFRLVYSRCVVEPFFRSIITGGKRAKVEQLPYIRGPGRIAVGDDARISGKIGVAFARRLPPPELVIGDSVFIGHQVAFAVARRIEVGDGCLIATGARIMDNDGHPLDAEARKRHERVADEDIAPVTIGSNVWIGVRAMILKGVTIGDNAVIGAGAIVTKDVPANTVVAGNPARVIRELVTTESTEDTEK